MKQKKTKQRSDTVVLSANGRAELAVQETAARQQTVERLARFEAVEAIRLGIAAAEKGRRRPARKALAELQNKLGIPG